MQIPLLHHVGDDAAGNRRHLLLAQRGKGDNAVIDLVAADFFVLRDQFLEGRILVGNKALSPPHLRGLGLRVGDVGPRQRAGGRKPERTAEYRTSSQIGHSNFPSCSHREFADTFQLSIFNRIIERWVARLKRKRAAAKRPSAQQTDGAAANSKDLNLISFHARNGLRHALAQPACRVDPVQPAR